MKKVLFGIALVVAIIVVVGCGSGPLVSPGAAAQAQPVIGAEGVLQPEWVRKLPRNADYRHFIGEGRDGNTITAKKSSARAAALQLLAEWKASKTAATIKDYLDESGESGNTQSLESLRNAIVTKARANTSGLEEFESWVAADGHYVILYGYPLNDFRGDFKAATNEFVRSKSAEAAKLDATKLQAELETELDDIDY
jgi:hypothetical protein